MLRIANLSIDLAVFDHFPESVAREECILPIGFRGERFRVVAGRRPDNELREALHKAAYITNLRLAYTLMESDQLKTLVDELYSFGSADISNCNVEFKFRCPRQWLQLCPTQRREVRFCDECNRSVYLCKDEAEAKDQTQLGRCVAVLQNEFIDVGLLTFPEEAGDK